MGFSSRLVDRCGDEVDDAVSAHHDKHTYHTPEHVSLPVLCDTAVLLVEKKLYETVEEICKCERKDKTNQRIEYDAVYLGEQRINIRCCRMRN